MVPTEPFCLLPYTHFLATAGKLATERRRGNRGLSSGPILKLRNPSTWLLGLLHAEPTRGQDAAWSPKWRSKSHFRSAEAPDTVYICDYICHATYDKVEKDVRFYDYRISICLNYTLALLKKRQPIARLHKKHMIKQTPPGDQGCPSLFSTL